ncbi:putative cadmium-transporting ATPase [Kyrpidia spormannii]|uniref:Cadmium-transporting ATPase n=1 Tax=Kyrpidia spormannii TaxID=2055160 RepID=A0ACA8Z604_9BACL|nr:heavy metal translocating P-type ATPase [Kyrpidia spormannii]CAB3390045.1 putative cadmium-transporting ATPase [Kyrpidia spormannii]
MAVPNDRLQDRAPGVAEKPGQSGNSPDPVRPPEHVYRLANVSCADCAAKFEDKVKRAPGVLDARVLFGSSQLIVVGQPLSVDELERLGAFDNIKVVAGTDAAAPEVCGRGDPGAGRAPWWAEPRVGRAAMALLLIVAAHVLQGSGAAPVTSTAAYAAAVLLGGWGTFKKGIPGIFRLDFHMNALMTVSVAGAMAIGYWSEAATVAFLFGVSEALENHAMDRARRSIRSLAEMAPTRAMVRREGKEMILPVEAIRIGDVMIVRPGEKIALDGRVIRGRTEVNQAAITGESLPVAKEAGDAVFAGSLNHSGAIEVEVTTRAEDSTLARVIALVEKAEAERAPTQEFVNRFARIYTPAVTVLAVGMALIPPLVWGAAWQPSIYEALALLMVACPCALVVSTPLAVVTAMGVAARNGVLIKGGIHLENIGHLRAMAFDKTGTLTLGEPVVTDVVGLQNMTEEDILRVAAGIERYSEHPLAGAILRAAADRGLTPGEVEDFESFPGRGARGTVGGAEYWIGSPPWFKERGVDLAAVDHRIRGFQEEGKTLVLLGRRDTVTALIALADRVRPSAREVVANLKMAGIGPTVLLTGDNQATARAIGRTVGVDEVRAGLLPEDKVRAVSELRQWYGRVGMVGDGVNDAPALVAATTGIAMGTSGTDLALEAADVALMNDDLSKVPFAVHLGRVTLRIIQQNIFIALFMKTAALLLAFPGWLTLWLAIVGDMGATLLVTANSLRLLRVRLSS